MNVENLSGEKMVPRGKRTGLVGVYAFGLRRR